MPEVEKLLRWDNQNPAETVCLLYREKVDFVSVPYEPENADYLKRISGSATYEEIKEWIMEKYNTKVSSLYVAQIKQSTE